MNSFDIEILYFINQFSQQSWAFDSTIKFISNNHLIKGGILLILFWWGWFKANNNQALVQRHLISTIIGCFFAMLVARALALLLTFRLRPLHDDNLNFTLPYSMRPTALEGWSSFPSDHAVLFYALSAGMFYISKKAGIFAIIYTTLFIAFPRVYLGLHYPSDIVVGAIVGIMIVVLCQSSSSLTKVSQTAVAFSNKRPEIFYPFLFITTYQIADMFNNSRSLVSFLIATFE